MKESPPTGGRKLSLMTTAQFEAETPIDFKSAAGMFRLRPSRQLLYRWRTYGVANAAGECCRLGWYKEFGQIWTTKEAVARFKKMAGG